MKNSIDKLSCCYENGLLDNFAHINLNTNVLRYGDCKLPDGQIKDIIFILSNKLLNFAQTGGEMSNLSAKTLFAHLQQNNNEFSSNNSK